VWPEGDKLTALNLGEAQARGAVLVYLDADVTVEPALIGQLAEALRGPAPRYASGTPQIAPAQSALTRDYGRFWVQLPFVQIGVPGFGLFAMSRAGRTRWQHWPDIIADDTFARLSFAPAERIKLPARYTWPMVEGLRNLIRVRRRQNAGVAELVATYPFLQKNDDKVALSLRQLLRLMWRDPLGFAAYALVSLAVKSPLFRSNQRWARGR
jgi:glycosyltransferase involved in cell wall biosynthesis